MVQMTAADQAVVKAMPGNNQCIDCGMKNPQWASVSFGTVFCLECSGVHRYDENDNNAVIQEFIIQKRNPSLIPDLFLYLFVT